MNVLALKEVAFKSVKSIADKIPDFSKESNLNSDSGKKSTSDNPEKADQIAENRKDGANREEKAYEELKKEYPENEGYKIEREQYLRDKDGNIVRDSETGEARRIDFIVSKDGEVVKTVEVTSENAPKEAQMAKEERIKAAGGNYIKDRDTGELMEIKETTKTEVRRYP